MEGFLSKLEERGITWYMALWDNGQRVKRMPGVGGGGHEGGENTAQKRETPDSSERKQGSFPYLKK
jgi:hypothetical protein